MAYTAEVIIVTPSQAAQWLATSLGNPRWKGGNKLYDEKKAAKIANDISNGDWHPGSNSISFGEEGNLLEGHHRLAAIIKAGIAVPCVVVRGISKAGELHIDDNDRRTERQRTGYSTNLLSAANVHNAMIKSLARPKYAVVSTELKLRWVDLHPAVFEAARLVDNTGTTPYLMKNGPGCHAYMCAIEAGVSNTKLKRFLKCVNSGFIDGPYESAAIVVRNFLLGRERSVTTTLMSSIIQCGIYDFCNGTPRRKAYTNVRPKYFDINVARGNPLYISFLGRFEEG